MIERLFNPYDIRGTYPQPLNEEDAWKVGYATALYLQRSRQGGFAAKVKQEGTIVVGRDGRAQAPSLAGAIIEGIRAGGTDAVDLGMVDTPFIYCAINHLDCVAGIMVTGSHTPPDQVGFQISGPKAKPIANSTGLEDIRRIAGTLRVGRTGLQGKLEQLDLWADYRRHVLQFLKLGRKMRVAVDASNGMAGWMIPAVFEHVAELEITPLLFETDGRFVHSANPMEAGSTQMLQEMVVAQKLDLGVCFAADGGRCVFVDEGGDLLRPDLVAAIIARDTLSAGGNAGATVIHDSRCSRVLAEEIAAAGGTPLCERVGKPSMKRAMADKGAIFGAESVGHYYFRENYNADSGAIAFARMLSIVSAGSTPLSELARPLRRYTQSDEINFAAELLKIGLRELADKFRKGKIDYMDGIKVEMEDWRFNLRKSNTEPVFRLNVECANAAMLDEKLAELEAMLGGRVR